jgi:hypothetical protein
MWINVAFDLLFLDIPGSRMFQVYMIFQDPRPIPGKVPEKVPFLV